MINKDTYKRLTEIRGGLVIDKCGNCPNVNNTQGCTDKKCYEIIKNRLAELENKIMDGTLIELPRIIHPNRMEWYVQYQYPNGVIQYYICFSEPEAEAKLKELQGEKK